MGVEIGARRGGVPVSRIGSVSLRPRALGAGVVQMRRRQLLEGGGLRLPWDSRLCVTQGVCFRWEDGEVPFQDAALTSVRLRGAQPRIRYPVYSVA